MMDIALGPEIASRACGRARSYVPTEGKRPNTRGRDREAAGDGSGGAAARSISRAGHVAALVTALAALPCKPSSYETRAIQELEMLPAGYRRLALVALPEALVTDIAPRRRCVVILPTTTAHRFMIARVALLRTDLAYVGMIVRQRSGHLCALACREGRRAATRPVEAADRRRVVKTAARSDRRMRRRRDPHSHSPVYRSRSSS